MKNSIVAKICFDFKGQHFEPSIEVDLDKWLMEAGGEVPPLLTSIAQANDIDTYSYELELMEMEPITFTQPQGDALAYYNDETKTFDFEGFYQAYLTDESFSQLSDIAQHYLGEPLVKGSALHQALVAASQL